MLFQSPVRKAVYEVVNAKIADAESEYAEKVKDIDLQLEMDIQKLQFKADDDKTNSLKEIVDSVLKFV